MEQRQQNNFVSPLFQINLMIVTTLYVLALVAKSIGHHVITDPVPQIVPITPQYMQQFDGDIPVITAGLFVRTINKFDMVKNEFVFDLGVWFILEPGVVPIETLSQFAFDRAEVFDRQPPYTRKIRDKIFVGYDFKLRMSGDFNYRNFPIDAHAIYLSMFNNNISMEEAVFDVASSNLHVGEDIQPREDWYLIGKEAAAGYYIERFQKKEAITSFSWPEVLFTLKFARANIRYILSILLPLLMLFFMSLFTFSLDPLHDKGPIIALSGGSVTGLVTYSFVIENISPKSGYFMLSDRIFFLFLGAIFFVFFMNLLTQQLNLIYKKIAVVMLHGIIITACSTLFLFWHA